MSDLPTQGQDIIVPTEADKETEAKVTPADKELTGFVMGKVTPWEDHRNRGWERKWKEYWRLWRGFWHTDDRTRQSERSRLIAPALAQAIDASAAEVETILLERSDWIDLSDDVQDQDSSDIEASRNSLLEDMDRVGTKDVISDVILNAAIFGTGIMKLNVVIVEDLSLARSASGKVVSQKTKRVLVQPER